MKIGVKLFGYFCISIIVDCSRDVVPPILIYVQTVLACAVGLSLRGTDFLLTNTLDLNFEIIKKCLKA